MKNLVKNTGKPQKKQILTWTFLGGNLKRYNPNGVYFLHAKVRGKLYRDCLDTTSPSVAKEKRDDLLKKYRGAAATNIRVDKALTFRAALELYEKDLDRRVKLPEHLEDFISVKTRSFYDTCIKQIRGNFAPEKQVTHRIIPAKNIPGIFSENILNKRLDKFSTKELQTLLEPVRTKFSATYYNGCAIVCRNVFKIGIENFACLVNPAKELKHATPAKKKIELPTNENFLRLVADIRAQLRNRRRDDCADLVEFLAYSAFRIDEAREFKTSDIKWDRNELHVRKGKGSKERFVPILGENAALLKKICQKYPQREFVFAVGEVRKSIKSACKRIGIAELSHHDFRHLFITNAIEKGVDIKTVSEWAGHEDIETTLNIYAHSRRAHGQAEAAKLSFGGKAATETPAPVAPPSVPQVSNVIAFQKAA